eukprot:jgi/Antlo1/1710/1568
MIKEMQRMKSTMNVGNKKKNEDEKDGNVRFSKKCAASMNINKI